MKTNLLILVLLLSSISLTAQTGPAKSFSPTELEVNETVIKFFDALSELDAVKLKQQVTTDFMLLEDGAVWNTDSLSKYFEPMKKLNIIRENKFNFVKTVVTDQTGWTAYYNRADMKIGQKQLAKDWLESAVLIKENGTWKIKLLHSTIIKPKGK